MNVVREVIESPIRQGASEQIPYSLLTTPWGGSPTSPVVTMFSVASDGVKTDVSLTTLLGAPSVVADSVITPVVKSLTAGTNYRLEIQFTIGSIVQEAWCMILAEE